MNEENRKQTTSYTRRITEALRRADRKIEAWVSQFIDEVEDGSQNQSNSQNQ
jgi:hypothetical protein